jgi:hypothetical protein
MIESPLILKHLLAIEATILPRKYARLVVSKDRLAKNLSNTFYHSGLRKILYFIDISWLPAAKLFELCGQQAMLLVTMDENAFSAGERQS